MVCLIHTGFDRPPEDIPKMKRDYEMETEICTLRFLGGLVIIILSILSNELNWFCATSLITATVKAASKLSRIETCTRTLSLSLYLKPINVKGKIWILFLHDIFWFALNSHLWSLSQLCLTIKLCLKFPLIIITWMLLIVLVAVFRNSLRTN